MRIWGDLKLQWRELSHHSSAYCGGTLTPDRPSAINRTQWELPVRGALQTSPCPVAFQWRGATTGDTISKELSTWRVLRESIFRLSAAMWAIAYNRPVREHPCELVNLVLLPTFPVSATCPSPTWQNKSSSLTHPTLTVGHCPGWKSLGQGGVHGGQGTKPGGHSKYWGAEVPFTKIPQPLFYPSN